MIRNVDGLVQGVDYKFNADGTVNWRAMVKKEYLVPNKDRFPNLSQEEINALDVSQLEDNQLLILLSGIKELAKLRGFTKSVPHATSSSPEHASCEWFITWIPCKDSGGLEVTTGDWANATTRNCNDFGVLFLEPIAANRAFVRCVRNYLGIYIVGADEVSQVKGGYKKPAADEVPPADIHEILENLAKSKGYTLTNLIEKVSEKFDTSKWSNWSDIPKKDAVALVGALKKKK